MYKIAISDLDGTLLDAHQDVSLLTKTSVEQWIADNRKFVIATGRSYRESQHIQSLINQPIYIISSNGGRIHTPSGDIIFQENLADDIAHYICQQQFPQEVQVSLFTDQHWHVNFDHPHHSDHKIVTNFLPVITNLKKSDTNQVIKMIFIAEPNKLLPIYKQLRAQFKNRVNLTFSLDNCLEVMPAHVNKGAATEMILKELGIHSTNAVAFGDGMNDVELLRLVGKPFLMKNSQPALIAALPNSDMTDLSSTEHGVAKVLDKLRCA